MREVDDALRRAYAQRSQPGAASRVPPSPHWTSRRSEPASTAPARFEPPSESPIALPPPSPVAAADRGVALRWPEVVMVLEREWGDRFAALADRLLAARTERNLKVLLFTSCHRAEGRTTLILALARALARHPIKTLLVDADLSGPMLGGALGVRPEVGLDDVVEDGRALTDALIEAPADRLWLLPMRSAVSRPRDFLTNPAWACSMARLRLDFDLVLLDGGPMFAGLTAATLHRSVDAAILVHSRGVTGQRAIDRAREVLEAGGVPLLGLAETFA